MDQIIKHRNFDLLAPDTGSEQGHDKARSRISQNASEIAADARIHESVYVDDQVSIGAGTSIWHFSHIQTGAKIGSNCTLGQNVNVANNVEIGDHVKIQNNVSVYEGVTLEDHVFVGPSVVFTNVLVPRGKVAQRGSAFYRKTVVREGAAIGANATIVCGHDIGRSALIAAGAVVTREVRDFAVMMGVPAKQHSWICHCGENIPFPLEGRVLEYGAEMGEGLEQHRCPGCQETFVFIPDEV